MRTQNTNGHGDSAVRYEYVTEAEYYALCQTADVYSRTLQASGSESSFRVTRNSAGKVIDLQHFAAASF